MGLTLLLLAVGLVLLVAGAELLVRGASRLAAAFRIPPLVVGLTVVAYGTSAPELAVSLQSALSGKAALALGNVIGSNVFNVLFILGLSALVVPLVVGARLVRVDVPVLVGLSALVWVLALDGRIGRLDGILLGAGALAYSALLVRAGRKEGLAGSGSAPAADGPKQRLLDLLLIALGLGGLILGSRWLVQGAVTLSRAFGMSELIIGLTVVAAGTSLPEVATSVVAAAKGERDIAVGNVVGSNLFNLLAVLGFTAALAPEGVPVPPAALAFDLPVMTAVALACLPVFFTGHVISRWEGGLFLAYYVAYAAWLVLSATGHAARPLFGAAMGLFVIPLTAITLAVLSWRAWRRTRAT